MRSKEFVYSSAVAAALVLLRGLANQGPYPPWLGSLEAYYTLAAAGEGLTGWSRAFILREYPLRAAFLLGVNEWTARLPSLAAYAGILGVAWAWARKTGIPPALGVLMVGLNPFLWVWSGRVLPDTILTLGFALGAYSTRLDWSRGRWYWMGGLLVAALAKPIGLTALILPLLHPEARAARTWRYSATGALLGLLGLLVATPTTIPYILTRLWVHPDPGGQATALIPILLFGTAGAAWVGFATKDRLTILAWLLLLYGVVDAWAPDAYYALPGITLAALLGLRRPAASTVPLVAVGLVSILVLASHFGTHGDDRALIYQDVPAGSSVSTPKSHWPLASYYGDGLVLTTGPAEYVVAWSDTPPPWLGESCGIQNVRQYQPGRVTIMFWCTGG